MNRQEGVPLGRENSVVLQSIERQLSIDERQNLVADGMPSVRLLSLQSSLNEASQRGESTQRLSASLRSGMPLNRQNSTFRRQSSVGGQASQRGPGVAVRRTAPDLHKLSRSFSVEARRVPSPKHETLSSKEDMLFPTETTNEQKFEKEDTDNSGGSYHVFSWGRHALAQDNIEVVRFSGRRIISAATSGWHALFVDSEGIVFAGGANEKGQCAIINDQNNDFVQGVRRVEQVPVGVKICFVATGLDFSAAVTMSGQVLTWGGNDLGQLGTNKNLMSSNRPSLVRGVLSRVQISDICCGEAFCLARSNQGEVFCWGDANGCCTQENLYLPARLDELAGVLIHKIAAGAQHAVAIDFHGTAYAWGRNNHGQCGNKHDDDMLVTVPQPLSYQTTATAAACGRAHTLLLTSSGNLIGFGRDHCGQLTGSAQSHSYWDGVDIVPNIISGQCVACACGEAHSLIALANGELVSIGRNQMSTCEKNQNNILIQKPLPPTSNKCIFIALAAAGDSSICVCVQPQVLQREDSFVWRLMRMVGAAGPHPAVEPDKLRRESSMFGSLKKDKDILSMLCAPSLLASSWIVNKNNIDTFGQQFIGIDHEEKCKMLETSARRLLSAGSRAVYAGNSVLSGLCATSFLGEIDSPFCSRSEWLAAREWAQVLLATSDKARAEALAMCLPSSARDAKNLESIRDAIRRPLRRLIITACHRAALQGRLPSGDGIELQRAAELISELDRAADSNAAERAALSAMRAQSNAQSLTQEAMHVDSENNTQEQSLTQEVMHVDSESNTQEQSTENRTTTRTPSEDDFRRAARSDEAIRSYLEPSAALYAQAKAAERDGYIPTAPEAFSAALIACGCLELLRSASAQDALVPRLELSRGYRIAQCDQLGVMIAQKLPTETSNLFGVVLVPGALLVDFLRWRKSGAPSGPKCLENIGTGGSTWWLSAFGFLFSPETKRELCAAEARFLQGEARTRAVQQSHLAPFLLFGFPVAGTLSASAMPYLILKIPRSSIIQATMNQVRNLADEELSKELRVIFDDEPAIDEGGVRKEFFQLIVPMLFDPVVGMFSEYSNCVYFNTDCDWYDEEYELAGLLLGLAVYNSVVLDLRLPNLAYKKLLAYLAGEDNTSNQELTLTLDDLADLDPSLAHGLQQLLDFDGDVESAFCRNFSDDDGQPILPPHVNDSASNINFNPDTPVTAHNRDAYVRGFLHKRLCSDVETQFSKFAHGFARVMRSSVLQRLVEPNELALMVQGDPELDFFALKQNTYYEGWKTKTGDPSSSPIIKEFWRLVTKEFTPEEKKQLLMFFSGSKSAPMGGLSALKPPHHSPFRIQRAGPDSDRLPTASTCFNTLLIPDYEPPSKLGPLLRLAIANSEGSGLNIGRCIIFFSSCVLYHC